MTKQGLIFFRPTKKERKKSRNRKLFQVIMILNVAGRRKGKENSIIKHWKITNRPQQNLGGKKRNLFILRNKNHFLYQKQELLLTFKQILTALTLI